ncbi:hypothetical protein KEM54_001781 [Ascosphaera aggregata]|nr:hypothetical protein KEM54_001781 [Ascosphaera aggregata]
MAYFTTYPTYNDPSCSSSLYSPFFQLLDGFDGDVQPLYSVRPVAAAAVPAANAAAGVQRKSDNHNRTSPLSPSSAHSGNHQTTPGGAAAAAAASTPAVAATFIQSFSPRFDVRESRDAYLLDGELPGVNQKDIDIEFTDPHTLRIKGVTVRGYRAAMNASKEERERNKEESDEDEHEHDDASSVKSSNSYQATVEDVEDEEDEKLLKKKNKNKNKNSAANAVKKTSTPAEKKEKSGKTVAAPTEPPFKYWSSERAVGSFHRTFNFPARVNQDAVRASLKDGILSVVVPKEVERKGGKKITVTVE